MVNENNLNNLEILCWKLDWINLRAPIKNAQITSPVVQEIIEDLGLTLKKESANLYRDDEKKIALLLFETAIEIQYEGQFFNDAQKFEQIREYLSFLNSINLKESKLLLWKISRADIAVDILDVEPKEVLPSASIDHHYSFSAQSQSVADTKKYNNTPTTIGIFLDC